MKQLLISFFIFNAGISSAYAWPFYDCGYFQTETWTLQSEVINSLLSSCQPVPLKLFREQSGPYQVDAWRGGYERTANVTYQYRIDHYDRCNGRWEGTEYRSDTSVATLSFNIVNPNLAPGASTYLANAPLTDSEAQSALADALKRCQQVRPGPAPQQP